MNTIAISVKDLSKSFRMYNSPAEKFKEIIHPFKKRYHKEFVALKNISFDVENGESVGLVGRNGAGKSTLLQVICGILNPTGGTVTVNGEISALLELGAGFNKDFTGRDNIYVAGSLRGFSKEEIDARFQRIVDFADIGDFIEQPVKTYSSGMFVRLAFANAIHIDPDILIVDEALAVGDQLFQRKCYSFLEKFREQGKTLIFVSHSTLSINQLCSRALLIDGGELILDGSSKSVTTQYERLLFARPGNAPNVRKEIIGMKSDPFLTSKSLSRAQENSVALVSEGATSTVSASTVKPAFGTKPVFIEDLQPKSTVEYKNYDVAISDIEILTLEGDKVNSLVMNQQYIYSYKVKFNMSARDVSFGMVFKTEKGVILGAAASYQLDKHVDAVSEGDVYKVDWYFKCYLLPNIYFADVGVSALIDGSRIYLNRIVDALAFKVQPTDVTYHGLVNFDHYPVIEKMMQDTQAL